LGEIPKPNLARQCEHRKAAAAWKAEGLCATQLAREDEGIKPPNPKKFSEAEAIAGDAARCGLAFLFFRLNFFFLFASCIS